MDVCRKILARLAGRARQFGPAAHMISKCHSFLVAAVAMCAPLSMFFLLSLCLSGSGPLASELQTAESALKAIKASLIDGNVARAEIFYMPYDLRTLVRIRPELLETQAHRKITVRIPSPEFDDLVHVTDQVKLTKIETPPDLRWGMVLFDSAERRTGSIYLDGRSIWGTGRKGYVNGVAVGLNRALIDWFERNFYPR
jgi:hypothetical protein